MSDKKLVIFDAYAIIYRAYFALPTSLTDLQNEPINAVYGLISMLFKVIEDTRPTHIAFAYDTAAKTFRDDMFEEYRAQREAPDDELISQFPKSIDIIQSLNIPMYSKDGYEADDVIGTITHHTPENILSLVVTGDRDMLQLVDTSTHLLMPQKSLSDAKEFDIEATIQKMGVIPEKIVDLKALMGDSADNYKGVPGIGPKTAIKLLDEYGDLENIYKNVNKIAGKTGQLLTEHKESALMSQKLARIARDVDIEFDLAECEKWELWNDQVDKKFTEIGFKTLKKRAEKLSKDLAAEKQGTLF